MSSATPPREPQVIETLPESGYRLIVEFSRSEQGAALARAASSTVAAEGTRKWGLRLLGTVGVGSVVLVLLGLWFALAREEFRDPSPAALATRPAIAVIPFWSLGRVPEDDYFTNGITADLITDLSKRKGLLVIAPGTAFACRRSPCSHRLGRAGRGGG